MLDDRSIRHPPQPEGTTSAGGLDTGGPAPTTMVEGTGTRPLWLQLFGITGGVALGFGVLTLVAALTAGLPLRDPDGLFGPSYVRLPLIALAMIALDVIPRAVVRRAPVRGLPALCLTVLAERWPVRRLAVVAVGLATFYVAYVSYRNLKSFLPFLRDHLSDPALVASDLWLAGGRHPGDLLHELLGTGVSAQVLSFVYILFLFFVPFSLAASLVWSHHLARGAWYVNALSLNWILGTLSYYAIPSLGPIYVEEFRFADLPVTETSQLQDSLWDNRLEVLAGPHLTQSVHGIAAFASLHVSIVFTAALVAELTRLPRPARWVTWTFFALTAVATVYFGWHYVVDVVAGVAIGALAVWLGGLAIRPRPRPGELVEPHRHGGAQAAMVAPRADHRPPDVTPAS